MNLFKRKIFIPLVLLIFLVLFFGWAKQISHFLASVFLTSTGETIEVDILYAGNYQKSANLGDLISTTVFIQNKSSETVKLTQIVLGNKQNNNFLSYIDENSYKLQYTNSKGVQIFSLTDSGQNGSNGYRIFNITPLETQLTSLALPAGSIRQYQVSVKLKDNIPLDYLMIEFTDIYGSGVTTGSSLKSQGSLSAKINILQPTPTCQNPVYQCSADLKKVLKVCENGTSSVFQDCSQENNVCSDGQCIEKIIPLPQICFDGTDYGQCSQTKPKYCQSGVLIDHCKQCSCLSGQVCQTDNSCKQPLPEPKTDAYLHLEGVKSQYNIGEQVILK